MFLVRKLRRAISLVLPIIALIRQFGDKRLVIELAMVGELPYVLPLLQNADKLAGVRLILMPKDQCDLTAPEVVESLTPIRDKFFVMRRDDIQSLAKWFRFDGFLTSEQFSEPLLRPAVCIFHGQPSKGLTFSEQVLRQFDHFFHLGPLHRKALDEFVASRNIEASIVPRLHEVGYPKTDWVIRDKPNTRESLFSGQLKSFDRVILYAPAFNKHCTLHTIGEQLTAELARQPDTGVIVKLAPDMIGTKNNDYATNGIDWQQRIESWGWQNVFIGTSLDIGSYILAADLMVTDVSGVGYEFLATGKPVIYFECLDFYSQVVLPKHPELVLSDLLGRDTMNGGRQYGTVVRSLAELSEVLSKPLNSPAACEMQQRLLYNPGHGSDAMVRTLARILAEQ